MDPDAGQYNIIIKIIFLIFLLILSGFFSSAETAFMSLDKIKIRNLSNEGNKAAKRVEKILNKKDITLSAILIGNNFANLFASSITTTLVYQWCGGFMISIATGILTFIILIFGEIIPKNIATKYSEKIAMKYSLVLSFIIDILYPFIFIINKISTFVMKILRIYKEEDEKLITEEDFKTIIDVSQEEGVLEEEEHQLIHNVIDFGDSCAKDIMVPRTSISSIQETDSFDTIMNKFKQDKYTRLVVYNKDKDDIIGIINIRDMIHLNNENFNINNIMRKPYITYEHKKISDLLTDMKKTSNNMAIVINEYGSISGLLTLEDILEEIVGEIRDEYDEDELKEIIKINDKCYEIDGNLKLIDLNKRLNISLESEDYDTICGYCIEKLNYIPNVDDVFETDNFIIKILETSNNHIDKIRLNIKD